MITKELLIEILRKDDSLSQLCVSRLVKYVLNKCHDLAQFKTYTQAEVLKVYSQNYKKKPFAGKDFFKAVDAAQKLIKESEHNEAMLQKAKDEEARKAAEREERRNPRIKIRVLRNALAMAELGGKKDDDYIDWDTLLLCAKAFDIQLDGEVQTTMK